MSIIALTASKPHAFHPVVGEFRLQDVSVVDSQPHALSEHTHGGRVLDAVQVFVRCLAIRSDVEIRDDKPCVPDDPGADLILDEDGHIRIGLYLRLVSPRKSLNRAMC